MAQVHDHHAMKNAKWKHLNPLSTYSRLIIGDKQASLPHRSNPLINFKIEVVNNCMKKRKFDDSCADEGYETPAKEPFSPTALSPDLGCFIDFSSPPCKALSPLVISKPLLVVKTQDAARSEIKEAMSSQLHSEYVECGSSTEPVGDTGSVPLSLRCETVRLNIMPTFDCDVNDLLRLNPVGTVGGFLDNVESYETPNRNTFQHVQKRRDEQVDEKQEELGGKKRLSLKNVEEDQGYFSMSYVKGLELGQKIPPLSRTPSSPLLRLGERGASGDECHSEYLSEPGCPKQAELCGQLFSFTVSHLCPIASGPLLESVNAPIEPLEGDVEEEWTIGPPIFESSVCHSATATLNAGNEPSGQGGVIESIPECQATPDGDETTLDTSYESTLPLQVQVKSVVVAPNQLTSSSKPAAPPLQEQSTKPNKLIHFENRGSQSAKCVSSARRQRPVVFERRVDWEREKQLYVSSVTRHLNENSGRSQDVMTELLKLMTHVADQTPGTSGSQWQHPSDLTRRNYQRRFGNMMPKMALHEWQAKNCPTNKRFAKVPKFFERSPLP